MAAIRRHPRWAALAGGALAILALWALLPAPLGPEAEAASPTLEAIEAKLDTVLAEQAALVTANEDQNADDARALRSWVGLPSAAAGRYELVLPVDFGPPTGVQFVAVLDHRTGLVWARTPENGTSSWVLALAKAAGRNTGGVTGWRLPSFAEFASIMLDTNADDVSDELDPNFPIGPGDPTGSFWMRDESGRQAASYGGGVLATLVPHALVVTWSSGPGAIQGSESATQTVVDPNGVATPPPQHRAWFVMGPE